MGTSRSFRAPSQPRWQAFSTALAADAPDRVRSEFFNASQDWIDSLASPSVEAFGSELGDLFDSLPQRLSDANNPGSVLADVLAEARARSREAGASSADVFAERAFAAVVLGRLGGAMAMATAERPGQAAAERWSQSRGSSSSDLVAEFAGAVFGQLASHYADREAGSLVESGQTVASTAASSSALADRVAGVARQIWRSSSSGEPWSRLVRLTVAGGSSLPESE